MSKNHTEQIEKLIAETLSKYAKENEVKITSNANYDNGTIKVKIYE